MNLSSVKMLTYHLFNEEKEIRTNHSVEITKKAIVLVSGNRYGRREGKASSRPCFFVCVTDAQGRILVGHGDKGGSVNRAL